MLSFTEMQRKGGAATREEEVGGGISPNDETQITLSGDEDFDVDSILSGGTPESGADPGQRGEQEVDGDPRRLLRAVRGLAAAAGGDEGHLIVGEGRLLPFPEEESRQPRDGQHRGRRR